MRCCVERHGVAFSAATKRALKAQLAGLEVEMAALTTECGGGGGVFSPPAAASPTGSPRASFVSAADFTPPAPFLGSEGGAAALADRLADVVRARAGSEDGGGGGNGNGAAAAAAAVAAAAPGGQKSCPPHQAVCGPSGSPSAAARRTGAKEAGGGGGGGPATRHKETSPKAAVAPDGGGGGAQGTHLRSSSLPDLPQQLQQAEGARAGLQSNNYWGVSSNSSAAGRTPAPAAAASVGKDGSRDAGGGDGGGFDPLQGYDPDVCTLGLAGRVALPNTAVRDTATAAAAAASSSSAAASLSAWGSALRGRSRRGGEAGGVGSPSTSKSSSSISRRDRNAAPLSPTSTSSSSRFTASKQLLARGKKWLLDKSKPRDRWSDYRIGEGSIIMPFAFVHLPMPHRIFLSKGTIV